MLVLTTPSQSLGNCLCLSGVYQQRVFGTEYLSGVCEVRLSWWTQVTNLLKQQHTSKKPFGLQLTWFVKLVPRYLIPNELKFPANRIWTYPIYIFLIFCWPPAKYISSQMSHLWPDLLLAVTAELSAGALDPMNHLFYWLNSDPHGKPS